METLLGSPDPDVLTRRLSELIAAGRIGAARPMLAALRRLGTPSARVAELAAILAMQEGRLDAARAELDAALIEHPGHAALYRRRAELRRRTGDLPGAALDAADAVVHDPADASGKAILGVLMTELGRVSDAISCLQEAVASDPAEPSFRQALATAQAIGGDADRAAETLAEAIAAAPGSLDLRNAAVLLAVRRHRFDEALILAETARRDGLADACLFGLKGHALSKLGRHDEAAEAYAEALKLGPADPYVRHLVAASGALPEASCAPIDYVRAVFDNYADRFDAHLISLGYRIPGVIRAALLQHAPLRPHNRLGPVLDLGCGTGLVAVALSDLPLGAFTGVDVSPRMLAKAEAKQLYATLHEADITDFLAADTTGYAVIVAADVLCYFGAINELMTAVSRRLQPDGLFTASFEELEPGSEHAARGWALGPRGRYAHTTDHIATTAGAAGLTVLALEHETVRNEAGVPVPGRLAVLRH
ncbi:MAG TPA: tetratricopeptide repeat protein [Acetobacteraceae bacterium]|nr:tetratricopeptide repeat protein [Acetobacteraceae bacterium]